MSEEICFICGHVAEGHDAYHKLHGDAHAFLPAGRIGKPVPTETLVPVVKRLLAALRAGTQMGNGECMYLEAPLYAWANDRGIDRADIKDGNNADIWEALTTLESLL